MGPLGLADSGRPGGIVSGNGSLIGCTVASPAYHGHARVLADSFLAHHPGSRFVILDLARAGNGAAAPLEDLGEGIETLGPAALEDEPGELERVGLAYSTQGLAGWAKPRILRHLLGVHGGPVALIDSDIFVLGSLDDLGARARAEGTIATPHLITPHPQAERPTLVAGTLNSGFVVVAEPSAPLLEWWCARTRRDSIFRPAEGLVWEQTWLGLAPAFFDFVILRDAGINAMTRELLAADVEWRDGQPLLSGRPLRALHFSGPYDPQDPEWLLSQADEGPGVVRRPGPAGGELPWLSLAERPGAGRLSREYAERLLAAGAVERRGAPAPFGKFDFRAGSLPIHQGFRSAYREGLIRAESAGAEPPPNPFAGASGEQFVEWLAEAPSPEAERDGLNRFLLGMRAAASAITAFPQVPGADAAEYRAWAAKLLGRKPLGIPSQLLAGLAVDAPNGSAGRSRRSWRRR